MKKNVTSRLLSLVLVLSLLCGLAVPAMAAPGETTQALSFEKVETNVSVKQTAAEEIVAAPDHASTDVVRVSIILDKPATLMAGYASAHVADNTAAVSYRESLRARQDAVAAKIESALGCKLDVVRHLTLAVNLISANVQFGQIETIEKVAGVQQVVLETKYEPQTTQSGDEVNMSTSTNVVGARTVWANGYTGAGSKVAVIDTGLDTDHQSFAASGYNYSMGLNAAAKEMTLEEYKASVGVLTMEQVDAVLTQLNAYESSGKTLTAEKAYLSDKVPYAYNYIDENFVVDHDHDDQGEHGSHVEGTAAANRYIPQNGSFVDALTAVRVAGNAPDAQILTMKVFGAGGGAYDSDYMAAIEDAIILGADAANLSLGSSSPGFAFNPTYQELLAALPQSSTVVSISAGNAYSWNNTSNTGYKYLYIEDVSMDTVGSPGSYTNSLCVAALNTTSSTYSFASFSSWGIPGSLTMKPEISAPGQNIYSVNGAKAGGTSYENMSGTSMAAPQITGMTGLMGQYVRETGLAEKTGKNARQLANSLLMSTAVPLKEGANYFPILRQGAGMGRIDYATTAKTYIWMDEAATASAHDGKVKVELGDDPARTGAYEWTFTINNFSEDDLSYTLNTNLFTQAVGVSGEMVLMNTTTTPLAAEAAYTVNGETISTSAPVSADVDKDGDTDIDDAQAILNNVAGLESEIELDLTAADVDKDGAVTSYDAYLLLNGMKSNVFTVAAGESAVVTVKACLTDTCKETLNDKYPNGAYVQGYTFIEAEKDDAGKATDVTHSIPVLGFYGNWTEPSMFDAVSITDSLSGTNKLPYTMNTETNGVVIHSGESLKDEWILGNPYVGEPEFPADKLALRSDVTLYQFRYNLIRNASTLFAAVQDADGKVVFNTEPSYGGYSAYYYVNGRAWQGTTTRAFNFNKSVTELGFQAGDKMSFGYYAIPEYYGSEENQGHLSAAEAIALVESGKLGKGASIGYTVAIDDEAPVITSVTKDMVTGAMTVTAQDDNYVAAVMITNKAGTKVYGAAVPDAEEPGQVTNTVLDYSGDPGAVALLVVGDYAGNESAYEIRLAPDAVEYEGKLIGYTANTVIGAGWKMLDPAALTYTSASNRAGMTNLVSSKVAIRAAEYVDGYVFMVGSDNCLYAAELKDLDLIQKVGTLSAAITDLAYNYTDGKLYGIANVSGVNNIYSVNLKNAALTSEFSVSVTNPRSTSANYKTLVMLAIDNDGTFYSVNSGNSTSSANYAYLYKWTTADIQMPQYDEETGELLEGSVTAPSVVNLAPVVNTSAGNLGVVQHRYAGALAWDHNNNVLYLANGNNNATTGNNNNKLWVVNTETGKAAAPNSLTNGGRTYGAFSGLFVVPTEQPIVPTTDIAESIELSEVSVSLLENRGISLTADVYPWTLTDKSVTWTTSDPSVATVSQNGDVRAVSVGTAIITATTTAEPHLTASCEVNVIAARFTIKGLLQDEGGTPMHYTWDLQNDLTWMPGPDFGTDVVASVANKNEGNVIFMNGAGETWAIDMEGNASLVAGANLSAAADDIALTGSMKSEDGKALLFGISGTTLYGGAPYTSGLVNQSWSLASNVSAVGGKALVALAWSGCSVNEETGAVTESFKAMTDNGYLLNIDFDGTNATVTGSAPSSVTSMKWDNSYGNYFTSLIMADDNEHFVLSAFDGNVNFVMLLTYSEAANAYSATTIGDFGDGVWPCTIYSADSNAASSEAVGTLNAVSGNELKAVGADLDEDATVITVTEDVDVKNGKYTVTFDAEALELVSVKANGTITAVNTASGCVVFAFASETAIEAGSAIAELTFARLNNEATSVCIAANECNSDLAIENDTTVVELAAIIVCPSAQYTDVAPNAWYHDAVDFVLANGLMTGTSETTFAPNAVLTRSQMVQILFNAAGKPEAEAASFSDVDADAWYAAAVNWAAANGIAAGYVDGTFAPNNAVSRMEMIVFLARFAKLNGKFEAAEVDMSSYDDASLIPAWGAEAMSWAIANGIVTGNGNNLFPNAYATRATVATVLQSYCKL